MSPLTIRSGTFVCTLKTTGGLLELPLTKLRKLWKIMFDAADENRDAIIQIRGWLSATIAHAHTERFRNQVVKLQLIFQKMDKS